MKVKDLFEFNPEAELCIVDSDYVPKPLAIYGWGGDDGSDKEDCTDVTLKFENWIEGCIGEKGPGSKTTKGTR